MKRTFLAGAILAVLALIGAFAYQHYLHPPPPPPPDPAELEALRQERNVLEQRLLALTEADTSLTQAPRASLLIGVPTSVTQKLVEDAVSGLLAEVRLTLRDLKVHKADVVKAKTALGTLTLGDYQLDVRVHEVQAVLKPGAPQMRFGGPKLGLVLPVELASGSGRATLRVQWDGRSVAGAVCGDLDLKRVLKGGVAPLRAEIRGEFQLSAEGDTVVATPHFRDIPLKLRIEPAPESWKLLDELIEAQRAVCRAALKKADVGQKLRDLVARGFPVTLPGTLLRPIRLPAGVRQDVDLAGRGRVTLTVKPFGLVAVPERFWYGGDVTVTPLIQ